ncbi:tRNA-dihydrouridine synthase family protein [Streptobacillus felis]|uniref:tRNA-dihydrouridine synthase n=1 Tax=Streptobacillus felis TaxID=1384509 RepID=A0A7Z0PEN8_9FUSO|nr:tRNA-dihydrouridine synthase family protein [Streptobacillus felis]NYV27644.1 tRNA-dihydrouridine synthase family protein [Streptobacillus felis]
MGVKIYTAPMAGVTDYTFRKIVEEFKPDLTFTEMVSVNQLTYTEVPKILRLRENNGVQLFGKDIELMQKAAKYVESMGVSEINLNCGCPMKKIVNSGHGSALIKDPKKIEEILIALKEVLKPTTNLSLKIRVGYDKPENYLEIAKIAEKLRCSHITIHGRTREQKYTGSADWNYIKEVKDNVNIKVIGNGDIFDARDAVEKIKYSKVDGIMLARGILGNPWLISQIRELLEFGEIKTVVNDLDRVNMAIRHVSEYAKDNDEIYYPDIRKYIMYYLEKIEGLDEIKKLINQSISYKETIDLLNKIK